MASDDFDRADAATPGANWPQIKGESFSLGIFSTSVDLGATGGNGCGNYWSADAIGADQFSEATVIALGSSHTAVVVRAITTGTVRNHYAGGADPNDVNSLLRIWTYVAGAWSNVANHASESLAAGNVVRLEVEGTALRLYINGVLKVSGTDASLSAGQPGLAAGHSAINVAIFDDWSGGDLTVIAWPPDPDTSLLPLRVTQSGLRW